MLLPLLAAAAVLLLSLGYSKLRYIRFRQHANLKQHPSTLLLGHVKLFGDYIKRNKPRAHPDMAIVALHRDLGRPPLMYLDMRPVGDAMVVVGNSDIADQITKSSDAFPTSPPKSSRSLTRLLYVTGRTSILAQHGDEWKQLRKRFNPGFAPQYISTFTPEILDKGLIFLDRLDALCSSGDTFSLLYLTTRLTFDIIGKVVMEADLDAQPTSKNQNSQGELISLYESLLNAYNGDTLNLPWWLTLGRVRKRAALAAKITSLLQSIVRRKHAELHSSSGSNETEKKTAAAARSVLSLSLQDVPTLTPRIIDETCDQLRTFLFAGHDTTSILLSWAFYELSRTPRALSAVRAELDAVFGPLPPSSPSSSSSPSDDTRTMRAHLLSPEKKDALAQLPYLDAVIKETLRVHPPGGTARAIPRGSNFSVRLPDSGETVLLDGLLAYNCQTIIHGDAAAFGADADAFVPERWLPADDARRLLATELDARPPPLSSSPGAWRPFERGPRNCIGQELAYIEARVIIALAARRYDFVKVGLGAVLVGDDVNHDGEKKPVVDEAKGQLRVNEEVYPTRQVTSKPVDGMMMRIKRAVS
ncbi:cytochrome P450 [Lasiosphaeria ovina]|uniref:Cytochrome P450 n=1 Tax=Lasiosphaeria ovina TaxID=92902 RepID=A0AAE0KCG0_9PEZI|nr:cytochrome P450 [Lasiosphaeria ovina]